MRHVPNKNAAPPQTMAPRCASGGRVARRHNPHAGLLSIYRMAAPSDRRLCEVCRHDRATRTLRSAACEGHRHYQRRDSDLGVSPRPRALALGAPLRGYCRARPCSADRVSAVSDKPQEGTTQRGRMRRCASDNGRRLSAPTISRTTGSVCQSAGGPRWPQPITGRSAPHDPGAAWLADAARGGARVAGRGGGASSPPVQRFEPAVRVRGTGTPKPGA